MIKAVTYILDNDTTVKSLVGPRSGATTDYKVFPVVVPATEKPPYIAVRLTGKTSAGPGCGYIYTVQVVCYETSYDRVTALNDAIVSALTAQASGTVNGVTYSYINFINESDDFVKDGHELYVKVSTFEGISA